MKYLALIIPILMLVSCGGESDQSNEADSAPNQDTIAAPIDTITPIVAAPFSGYKRGDVVFQILSSPSAKMLSRMTGSTYNNVGLIHLRGDGNVVVLDAIDTVSFVPIADWVARGEQEHYVVKRLRDRSEWDQQKNSKGIKVLVRNTLGKPYDPYFHWSADQVYGAEIVWKIHREIFRYKLGETKELGQFDLSDPALQTLLKERHNGTLPLKDLVISPEAIFNSYHLLQVYAN